LVEATEGDFGPWFEELVASSTRLHKMLYRPGDNSYARALAIRLTDDDVQQVGLQHGFFSGKGSNLMELQLHWLGRSEATYDCVLKHQARHLILEVADASSPLHEYLPNLIL